MRFELISGHVALDFVGTVAEWTTQATELLTCPDDLADWLVLAGLVDTVHADDADLANARELRAALYEHVRALTEDRGSARLAVINNAAASRPVQLSVSADGTIRRTGTVTETLCDVARAGILLAEPPTRSLIRWCDDPTCTRVFLDRSRGRRRRWCGMAGCGDRAKAAAYRHRRRTGGH
ncbi:CGNR zinc finger domain-containing protein [Pseudonocardia spinosispora]|uniref:CGNR zinc finger domain-containing protein n=1 Tax=Pseudonocardia spinosispora TaxID=103441 RepID=UPI0003F99BF2|nr:CGNR zinc finger domain-containing protein [Pseudonocardia spinosispora]